MTDRSRYRVALTLTVVLVVLTIATCWLVAAFAGVLAVLGVAVVLLPCLAFCCWRTWVMAPSSTVPGAMATACLTCEAALVRTDADPPHDIDVVATTGALRSLVEEGRIREERGDVPLADMLDLVHSDLKYTIVTYLTCLACGRTIFWGLCIRGAPVFRYVAAAEVGTHPWEAVPPREQWVGSRERERQRSALRVIDHRPGAWFLLERGDGELLLDARYSNGALIDDSAVLLLTVEERSAYRDEGDVFVNRLQERVHDAAPHLKTSPWRARNLKHLYGAAVDASIVEFLADKSPG